MRVMVSFNIADLQRAAEVTQRNASKYLLALERAGFLVRVRGNVSGRAGSLIQYRLVRDSGPDAPSMQTNGDVFDLNTRKHYSPLGAERKAL